MNMITKVTIAIVALASTAACALPSHAAPGWFNNNWNGYGYGAPAQSSWLGNLGNPFGFGNNNYQYPGAGYGYNNGYGYGNRYGNNFGRGVANIDQYQDRINNLMQRGISSGRITPQEAAKLQAAQTRINELEARLRASGNRLSFNERQRLTNELNKLHQRVRNEISDRQGGRRFW
jgi:uncharacterized protein YoaH (UPF0181 family)